MSLAGVFPGQGSQSLGMLESLADKYYQVRETFQEASDTLDFDLWSIVLNGPESDLNATENTQPIMLAAGVSVWRVWQAQGGKVPAVMAGHSLGEYSALVAAGVLNFADVVSLVRERGQLMQQAVPEGVGAMAAIIGLSDEQVKACCEQSAQTEVVEAVNFNSPGQVVIAGNKAAVERAMQCAKENGAKRALPLPVSVPSHCQLMAPAAEALASRMADMSTHTALVPVLHNADVSSHSDDAAIKDALQRQLFSPVRWVETVQKMKADGVAAAIEFGPGKVLTGLNKRIDKTITTYPVYDPETLDAALAAIGE